MSQHTRPRRTRDHRARARLAVLHAADDLLAEVGFGALTIAGIASRAGVARQTVYRHWQSKVGVLVDVLAEDTADEELTWLEETDSAREDLARRLRHHAAFLAGAPAGRVMTALVGRAQHDPAMAAAFRDGFLREQRERDVQGMGRILKRASGGPVGDRDVEHLLDVVLGALHYRVLTLAPEADPGFAGYLAAAVVADPDDETHEAER